MQVLHRAVDQKELVNLATVTLLVYKRLPLPPLLLKAQVPRWAVDTHQKRLAAVAMNKNDQRSW